MGISHRPVYSVQNRGQIQNNNHQVDFDLRYLFWVLLINAGLCSLLAYKVFTMSVAAPEQLAELQSILDEDLDDKERETILTKLFEVVSKRENTRQLQRDVVLKFSLSMLVMTLSGLSLVFRVLRRNHSGPLFRWREEVDSDEASSSTR